MEFGQIFVRGVVSGSVFSDRVRTLGPLDGDMGLRAAFIIGWQRMIVLRASRFAPMSSGA